MRHACVGTLADRNAPMTPFVHVQVITPFIDTETKEKFRFVAGSVEGKAAREELSKNFHLEDLEQVRPPAFVGYMPTR